MALADIKKRIKKAQANAGGNLGIVGELIRRKAYYDELTDEEKNAYCDYLDIEREALETVEQAVTGTLHFKVKRKPKPPTKEELREAVREVEDAVQGYIDEYNSPEAKAKRQADFMELQTIRKQRRAAEERGEDVNQYPLPWEK